LTLKYTLPTNDIVVFSNNDIFVINNARLVFMLDNLESVVYGQAIIAVFSYDNNNLLS
jgi:hypothetical protein